MNENNQPPNNGGFLKAKSTFTYIIRWITFLVSIPFDLACILILLSFWGEFLPWRSFLFTDFWDEVFQMSAVTFWTLLTPIVILVPIDLLRYQPRSKIILGTVILGLLLLLTLFVALGWGATAL